MAIERDKEALNEPGDVVSGEVFLGGGVDRS